MMLKVKKNLITKRPFEKVCILTLKKKLRFGKKLNNFHSVSEGVSKSTF